MRRRLWRGGDEVVRLRLAVPGTPLPLHSCDMESSTVRLRALDGAPLRDAKVRATVIAAAESIAERTGVRLASITSDDQSVTVTIEVDKLSALGFLAELRRSTDHWYAAKHDGASLWGRAPDGQEES